MVQKNCAKQNCPFIVEEAEAAAPSKKRKEEAKEILYITRV